MLWVFGGALERIAGPARLVAINVTLLGMIRLVMSALFSAYLFPFVGRSVGFTSMVLVAAGCSLAAFFPATVLLAMFLTIASPFHMPDLIQIDPSRRAAIQMLTAQLIGVGAGPLIASFAAGQVGIFGALIAAAALFAAP